LRVTLPAALVYRGKCFAPTSEGKVALFSSYMEGAPRFGCGRSPDRATGHAETCGQRFRQGQETRAEQ